MKHKTFAMIAGIIFAVVAIIHLLRITQGWELIVDGIDIPLWVNWVGLAVADALAFFRHPLWLTEAQRDDSCMSHDRKNPLPLKKRRGAVESVGFIQKDVSGSAIGRV